jgi:hypothetical protein
VLHARTAQELRSVRGGPETCVIGGIVARDAVDTLASWIAFEPGTYDSCPQTVKRAQRMPVDAVVKSRYISPHIGRVGMAEVLLVLVLLATAVLLGVGCYMTLRGFRAVDRPPVEAKPRPKSNPHDAATTAELKHFFEGKPCGDCGRPIPPVHIGEPRPGLMNPETHQEIAWEEIPTADLSATLESHVPICSHCLIVETFRHHHPELVVDRHRTM